MARISNHDVTPILDAAAQWRDQSLLGDKSILSDGDLWIAENLAQLRNYFVDALLDEAGTSFYEKLKDQLSSASDGAKRLAAEMLWVMFLFPDNVTGATKENGIRQVWVWSGAELPPNHPLLAPVLTRGIGSGGQGYNNYRWLELRFFILLVGKFKAFSVGERSDLLSDPWKFANWLDKQDSADRRQLRHMLVYLLFPDTFEPISSENHKIQLLKAFTSQIPKDPVDTLSSPDDSLSVGRDKALMVLRSELSNDASEPVNFYSSPWREKWLVDSKEKKSDPPPPPPPPTQRYWIEKTLVQGRPDRESGPDALGKALWSPHHAKGGADIYALMREVQPNDVVLHLTDNLAITGVSIVAGPRDEGFIGLSGTAWADVPCYRIPLREFRPLEPPLPRAAFLGAPKFAGRLKAGLEGGHKLFYNKDLDLNQGAYLTEAPPFLLEVLIEAYADIGAGQIPYLPPTVGTVKEELVKPPRYSIADAIAELFIDHERFESLLDLFKAKQNLILQGPPGCGKSFMALRLVYALLGVKDKTRVETVQFHQSYAYEDFIQGFRPTDAGGFACQDGVFFRFCDRARGDLGRPYVFVIDEINRGNLSKVFGETMLLVEADKRSEDWAVALTYGKKDSPKFYIPKNLFLLGMMNTADRSLAMVDYALRRRFAFHDIGPAFEHPRFAQFLEERGVPTNLINHIRNRVGALNEEIGKDADLGAGFLVGHSFFCPTGFLGGNHANWYKRVVDTEIKPLLKEYWFDKRPSQIDDAVDALRFNSAA